MSPEFLQACLAGSSDAFHYEVDDQERPTWLERNGFDRKKVWRQPVA
ncbi:hypothetical protein Fuma_01062 [Fuerstiella marisgermanici]|uniref:Uncharacterized protein n=1 Tax=Fuerstiella marisgermanici TaxID=1891926 RepID=A0A1P8WBQ5_9PLAN|nr:hypothetical protein Fuma_01062 [Fuerstiella marisgermanici]